jgi:hypothetical protein
MRFSQFLQLYLYRFPLQVTLNLLSPRAKCVRSQDKARDSAPFPTITSLKQTKYFHPERTFLEARQSPNFTEDPH